MFMFVLHRVVETEEVFSGERSTWSCEVVPIFLGCDPYIALMAATRIDAYGEGLHQSKLL